MNNRWRSHTSEKLFLAELQLKTWRDLSQGDKGTSKPTEEAFKQSAVLLLLLGWEGLLNELAEYHQQSAGILQNLDQLRAFLGDEIPELDYLSELEKDNGSWLYDLYRVSGMVKQPKARESSSTDFSLADDALIATSARPESVDSLDNIQRILIEFKEYLKQLRSRMSEW